MRLARHSHPNPAITFVLHGGFIEEVEGYEHVCQRMTVLVKPARACHANRYAAEGARSFIIECTACHEAFHGFTRRGAQVGLTPLVPLLLELYQAFRYGTPERAVLAEELSLEICHRADSTPSGGGTRSPAWLSRIEQMLRDGCTRAIRLSELGREAGVHPVYLARAFRRHVGRSVGSYMLHCRLERAMSRLAGSEDAIARIALEAGFPDQPGFTRMFRRELGRTPGQFREMARARFGSIKT